MKMPLSTEFRLWNLASLFSNLCLFVLMPFAFFFLESEGFAGLKKGIRARILETLVMLILLGLLILGIVWVASALIDNDATSMESLYDLWEFYLPYLYSCISLMGCLLLLLCTPVGLSRMFTVMGQLLVKPTILEDLDEQMYIITLEEEAIQRRLNGVSSTMEYNTVELRQELENVKSMKTKLERRKKASAWERNLVYPAVMILLLIETSISVLLVACNILCLLIDETAMPKGSGGPGIGSASLSTFGFVGAALEIILIFYLMVSSVVGFYSLRFFGNFTPRKDDTTMTKIIGNCVSILVLSSALPVMSRTLVMPSSFKTNPPCSPFLFESHSCILQKKPSLTPLKYPANAPALFPTSYFRLLECALFPALSFSLKSSCMPCSLTSTLSIPLKLCLRSISTSWSSLKASSLYLSFLICLLILTVSQFLLLVCL
ncbi:limb region 1 protein homolog isoform X4 [Chrysemys picta bellii]|uniref:limb region 1 protein homolog isoform X4 n=1 Tax=Chrysemys picta bellii TaxID=8478 RepID=UPI0032B1A3D0